MAQEDRESALEKLANWIGGDIKKVAQAKIKRKKELEEAAKQAGVAPQKQEKHL